MQVFTDYFQNQLGTSIEWIAFPHSCMQFGDHISTKQQVQLVRLWTAEEIKVALLDTETNGHPTQMAMDRSSSSKLETLLGHISSMLYWSFFNSGKVLRKWNHTLISLVPNSAHVSKVTDYWSISCCMVFYKVISKLLVSRISNTLDHILH